MSEQLQQCATSKLAGYPSVNEDAVIGSITVVFSPTKSVGTQPPAGASELLTTDQASNNAHLHLQADGDVAIKCTPGGTIKVLENDDTIFVPSDDADIATKKYVDDNAGGTAYWIQVWNARAYTRNLDWFHPHR